MDRVREALRKVAESMKTDPENICPDCGKPKHVLQLAKSLRHVGRGRYQATAFEPVERCECPKAKEG